MERFGVSDWQGWTLTMGYHVVIMGEKRPARWGELVLELDAKNSVAARNETNKILKIKPWEQLLPQNCPKGSFIELIYYRVEGVEQVRTSML